MSQPGEAGEDIHVVQCAKCMTIVGDTNLPPRESDGAQQLSAACSVKVNGATGKLRCAECEQALGTYDSDLTLYFLHPSGIKLYRVSTAAVPKKRKTAASDSLATKRELELLRLELQKEITDIKEMVVTMYDR
jgi:hypothetical protein